jgi:hypothetical protein
MIYILSFMEIDIKVQALLSSCLRNMSSCNAGITDGDN